MRVASRRRRAVRDIRTRDSLSLSEEQVICEFRRLRRFSLDDVYVSLRGKYGFFELHERMTQDIAKSFLTHLIEGFPFKIHTILTDNGAQFTYALLAEHLRPKNKVHIFDETCEHAGISHKLTKFRHPWTKAQMEIFNRKIKDHTTKKYHYGTVESLKKHLKAFLLAYNFQRPLKALKFKSPYDIILENYRQKPLLFRFNPSQKTMGLNMPSSTQSSEAHFGQLTITMPSHESLMLRGD